MNKLYFLTKLASNLNAIGLSINEAAVLAAIYSRSDDAKSITTKKLKEILGIRSLFQPLKVLGNMVQRVSTVKNSPDYNRVRITPMGENILASILNVNEK
jgi:hypothetical protein